MPSPQAGYQKNIGVVYKKTIGNYFVQTGGALIACALSPRLHKELIYPTADPNSLAHIVREVRDVEIMDPVAVGDEVRFVDTEDGRGLIIEILPRKSRLVRRSPVPMPSQRPIEQVIVANVDQVVPVLSAARPAPRWNLLDRYLASAESNDLPGLIVISKLDLAPELTARTGDSARGGSRANTIAAHPLSDLDIEVDVYRRAGYPVILTSSINGHGIEDLRRALQGRISVFVGQSGVGKTSLLNALQPGLGLRVKEVNQNSGKGRHTTTHLEMVPLVMGGGVVDTPGTREFGLWDVDDEDLAYLFPEMRPYIGRCKFGLSCTHLHEPGCAILRAISLGEISERRYQNYRKMMDEG
jgi:ribosome biogenesis GTPase